MYLRKIRRKKDGKDHVYWALVESVRTGSRVRQRTVCYLGDMDEEEARPLGRMARDFDAPPSGTRDLFEKALLHTVEILPERVRTERVRDFGDAFAGLALWRHLGLDVFFAERQRAGRESVAWATMIAYSAVARFCEASSELAVAESFTDRSALADLLGFDPMRVNEDRLYRTLDAAVTHKEALAAHLRRMYQGLFSVRYDLVLYDLTSVYFEGKMAGNAEAQLGYSRDGRPDCKQVVVGLVVTREGLPLDYEVFAGNRNDVTTLREVVQKIESKLGQAERIWVSDRGLASEANLAWLRQRGGLYLVGTPKGMLKRFERQMLEGSWREVREGLEVQFATTPEHALETFVLCRSADRRQKELAMVGRFAARIEAGLEKLRKACERPRRRLKDPVTAGRRLGALLKTNSRAAALFDVDIQQGADGRLSVRWKRKAATGESWAERTAGHYVLRTNVATQLTPEELWRAYTTLTQAEEAFRQLKSGLGVRPVYHYKPERVHGHLFICFLALVMLKTFEMELDRRGLGRSPHKVLAELRTLRSMDVILPTSDGRELRRRIVSDPEPALRILLRRMAWRTPKRLAGRANVVEKTAPHLRKTQQIADLVT